MSIISNRGKIYVTGFGPGDFCHLTYQAGKALEESDLIIGYTVYTKLVYSFFPDKQYVDTPMKKERERCVIALEEALKGKTVSLICSGDSGVYGLAGLIYEEAKNYHQVDIEIIPGVTAACSGAAILGAPLIQDFSVISLSDLLVSWEVIEKRLEYSAAADFVICLYNPGSKKRKDYLKRVCQILLRQKSPKTICGFVHNIGREGEKAVVTTLAGLMEVETDMFTTVFIGSSHTEVINGKMVTHRGYQ